MTAGVRTRGTTTGTIKGVLDQVSLLAGPDKVVGGPVKKSSAVRHAKALVLGDGKGHCDTCTVIHDNRQSAARMPC